MHQKRNKELEAQKRQKERKHQRNKQEVQGPWRST